MGYDHLKIEKKWQKYWEDNQTFKTDVWSSGRGKGAATFFASGIAFFSFVCYNSRTTK